MGGWKAAFQVDLSCHARHVVRTIMGSSVTA